MQDNFKFGDDKEIVRILSALPLTRDGFSRKICSSRADRGPPERRAGHQQEEPPEADAGLARGRRPQPLEHRGQPVLIRATSGQTAADRRAIFAAGAKEGPGVVFLENCFHG